MLINGFVTSSAYKIGDNFSLYIYSKAVVSNVLRLAVNAIAFTSVGLGYVVYNSRSVQATLVILVGTVGASENANKDGTINQGSIYFYGVEHLSTNQITDKLTFESKIKDNFDAQIDFKANKNLQGTLLTGVLTIGFMFVENQPSLFCSNCTDGKFYDGGNCVPACTDNTVPQLLAGNYSVCKNCYVSKCMVPNLNLSKCVCGDQCYPINENSCEACHDSCLTCNGSYSTNCLSCDFPTPTTYRVLVNGQCVCAAGYYDDSRSAFCSPCDDSCKTCNGPSNANCLTCSQSLLKNGSCLKTTAPPPCPINSLLVNDICQCKDTFVKVSNVCVQCPKNAERINQTSCRCKNSYVNISG